MKLLTAAASICLLTVLLTACGSDTKETTIVHERPVVVAPAGTSIDSVERNCPNGYDKRMRSCY